MSTSSQSQCTAVALLARYIHIVCAMLLVGGTLFYEMVVPVAIEDLRNEHQLEVMGRARWVFRWIVWLSVSVILLTGVVQAWTHWGDYSRAEYPIDTVRDVTQAPVHEILAPTQRPGWWWVAHASAGVVALLIALSLTTGRRPPERPVLWMRWNLVILLIVIFLATATFHVRLTFQRMLLRGSEIPRRTMIPGRVIPSVPPTPATGAAPPALPPDAEMPATVPGVPVEPVPTQPQG